jgi:tRNA(Arg) A34 adenosine deaminase TadA
MKSREHKYLSYLEKIAIAINSESANRARLAACLVYKNDIVAIGVNQMKSHPFQAKFSRNIESIYLHAETDCLNNALRLVSLEEVAKSTLYVCRVKHHDTMERKLVWGLSRPCSGCINAIATYDIRKVVYTCDNNEYNYL